MYILRCVRRDGKPDEDYPYSELTDALWHIQQFQDDDSDIYEKILVIDEKGNEIAGIYRDE